MKKRLISLLLTLLLACLPACAASFTDSVGRTVELPDRVERIAVSGPLAQIVLFSLAPDMMVGLPAAWAPEAEPFVGDYFTLPVLGQLYGGKGGMNMEEIAALDPQVVIDVGEPKKTVAEELDELGARLGIPFVHISMTTQSAGDAYRQMGKLLGREEQAEALAAYCEQTYARITAIMEKVGQENKVKLLYCLGDQGINVIARGSYHAEMIDMLADNLAVVETPSSRGTGNEVDMEQIMLWDPDYIIFAPDSVGDKISGDPQWQSLKAIRGGDYAVAPFGPYNWLGFPPSVQRCLGMLWMAKLLYPDQADYDLYEEVAGYFSLFYHTQITRAQFDELTHGRFPG